MDRTHRRRLAIGVTVPLVLVLGAWTAQARLEPTLVIPSNGTSAFGMPAPEPTRFTVTTSASVCTEAGPVRLTAVRAVAGSGLEVSDFSLYEYRPPADDSHVLRPLRETRYGTGGRVVDHRCGDGDSPPFLALELHRTGPTDQVAGAHAFEVEYDGWRTRTVVLPVGFWLCSGAGEADCIPEDVGDALRS